MWNAEWNVVEGFKELKKAELVYSGPQLFLACSSPPSPSQTKPSPKKLKPTPVVELH